MTKILLVGRGGFIGSVSRYTASLFINRFFNQSDIPIAALSVNIL